MLAVKAAERRNLGVQRDAGANDQIHCLTVQHRQCTRQTKAHWADRRVSGLVPGVVVRTAKQFRLGPQLHMALDANGGFVFFQQCLVHHNAPTFFRPCLKPRSAWDTTMAFNLTSVSWAMRLRTLCAAHTLSPAWALFSRSPMVSPAKPRCLSAWSSNLSACMMATCQPASPIFCTCSILAQWSR